MCVYALRAKTVWVKFITVALIVCINIYGHCGRCAFVIKEVQLQNSANVSPRIVRARLVHSHIAGFL